MTTNVQLTHEQLLARIAELEAKLPSQRGELSVSPKGWIMFQPKGRKGWPITLKAQDFMTIANRMQEIAQFIAAQDQSKIAK